MHFEHFRLFSSDMTGLAAPVPKRMPVVVIKGGAATQSESSPNRENADSEETVDVVNSDDDTMQIEASPVESAMDPMRWEIAACDGPVRFQRVLNPNLSDIQQVVTAKVKKTIRLYCMSKTTIASEPDKVITGHCQVQARMH